MPGIGIQLSDEQSEILDLVNGLLPSRMLFVTGRAGTGKSTLLRALIATTPHRIAVVAPTGIAAINVGGQTIHSLFLLPIGPLEPGVSDIKTFRPHTDRAKIVKNLDVLVIDEVSMVRADLIDAIDHSLRINRKKDLPFGGVTVVAFGDIWQLEPVVAGRDESEFLAHHYASPFFFDSRVVRQTGMDVFELKTVHRQASDAELLFALDQLRKGNSAEIGYFQDLVRPPMKGAIVLTATNARSTAINLGELARLPGSTSTYVAKVEGDFGKDLPAEQTLQVKPGAQVMFIKNGTQWVNGTIGHVVSCEDGCAVVRLDSGEAVTVVPEVWEKNRYRWDRNSHAIVTEPIGSFEQLPLRLAWAVTIHKAQGLTLEKAHIDLDRTAFAHGQVYVALSRCRSSAGLSLERAVKPSELLVSQPVLDFAARAGFGQ